MHAFGQFIAENRRTRGLTQRELAALVGMSPSALGMYEQGRRVPGRRARERLEGFFAARGMEMPPPPPVPEPPEEAVFRRRLRRLVKQAGKGQ